MNVKTLLTRRKALGVLNRLIEVCRFRISYVYTPNKDRLAWGRLLERCLTKAAPLLRDSDLEDLKKRVEKLEASA